MFYPSKISDFLFGHCDLTKHGSCGNRLIGWRRKQDEDWPTPLRCSRRTIGSHMKIDPSQGRQHSTNFSGSATHSTNVLIDPMWEIHGRLVQFYVSHRPVGSKVRLSLLSSNSLSLHSHVHLGGANSNIGRSFRMALLGFGLFASLWSSAPHPHWGSRNLRIQTRDESLEDPTYIR